ncbi:MAG: acyl--CoA ligase [Phenylobacterium sp.]|nr:acyl--CoA ligase [Phenylobacterium sp.]
MSAELDQPDLTDTITVMLDREAARNPNGVLIDFFELEEQLTFGDLADRSKRLAASLLAQGVRKSTHVALMMGNRPEWVVCWMAIARLGAVMIPVNPNYKPAELQFVLADSDAQVLILDGDCGETFAAMETCPDLLREGGVISAEANPPAGFLSLDALIAAGDPGFTPPDAVCPSDLLAIQYTSGTTGFPKGCLQTHEYWMMVSQIYAATLQSDVRTILVTFPFYYFEPQIQILMALIRGGTAYAPRRHSLTKFMDWLHAYPIDVCTVTPQLTNNIPVQDSDARTGVKRVVGYYYKGQEHLDVERRFGVPVREGFGMTEIGVGTILPVEATDMVGKGSCGSVAPFREAKVVRDDGSEAAVGEAGELWFRGRAMLLGYYKRPKANRESFSGGWFRTGDLARRDEQGFYWIVGRLKEMVKRSGENIAAQEVEAAIRSHPDVVEVGVIGVPDPKRKEEVKAYVVLGPGKTHDDVSPAVLAAWAEERLAAFKVPRYWSYVADFPRTATNKIAKQRLVDAQADLRVGAYDRIDAVWR